MEEGKRFFPRPLFPSSLLPLTLPPIPRAPMITLDRSSSTPVGEQLAEQLRYQIVSGRYRVGDALPSTRALGDQVGVSFHTVRKAYQALQADGLVEARVGSGYTVTEHVPLAKGERMERGAAVVHEALQRLLGLGLTEAEVEYLVHEQLGLLDHAGRARKVLFVAPSSLRTRCSSTWSRPRWMRWSATAMRTTR